MIETHYLSIFLPSLSLKATDHFFFLREKVRFYMMHITPKNWNKHGHNHKMCLLRAGKHHVMGRTKPSKSNQWDSLSRHENTKWQTNSFNLNEKYVLLPLQIYKKGKKKEKGKTIKKITLTRKTKCSRQRPLHSNQYHPPNMIRKTGNDLWGRYLYEGKIY